MPHSRHEDSLTARYRNGSTAHFISALSPPRCHPSCRSVVGLVVGCCTHKSGDGKVVEVDSDMASTGIPALAVRGAVTWTAQGCRAQMRRGVFLLGHART